MLGRLPLINHTQRRIIHVDMDAFYASVEEREHPEFVGRPLVIARNPHQTHGKGVVTTANYVARQFGVHSAMPAQTAAQLLAGEPVIWQPPNFPLYRSVSDQIHEIMHQVTPFIEPLALDEAYLDVTARHGDWPAAVQAAAYLQRTIRQQTRLTCSVGISYNKYLAKLASDYRKPFGRTIITPEAANQFLDQLPIRKFQGVGEKTAPRLAAMGITNGEGLRVLTLTQLTDQFGKFGYMLYRRVRGVDDRPVAYARERKSIGKERTFAPFLTSDEACTRRITALANEVASLLQTKQRKGSTITIKMRNGEFDTVTKRTTLLEPTQDAQLITSTALQLWEKYGTGMLPAGIRLLGVTVSGLVPVTMENMILPIFDD
ncbi:MAG: DNA polymerase IV [Schleiferilactobacillus perolens]|jgi:DNA polymerase-4|uniref:DNA polymerase IV n=1 Tax=Schleiferilactobacillus perolens DSM 12744 TaxID=1423792 RepID=A0A0R1N7L3_9LACO|nr:DNA polymerase IV [Schleiferilactobacillus perolens]KRL12280.1 dinP protein [Schleiferilactobacillus perolens DSM 12744]MCI1891228.1 DNA polymerase IV [Schleiferilactobacillus harbinensis]MCI1911834.1 DNA polymerase IV [Schleiferilactobacillus harbinensis]